MVIVESCAI